MKKQRVVRLARFATVCCALGAGACGDEGSSNNGFPPTTATTDAGPVTTITSAGDSSTIGTSTTDTGTVAATGAGGATSTMTSTTGELDTCTIASLGLFTRSDTDAAWDDNDFSDVSIESGCPTLVNVTWPHEPDWEDADPAEANFEETRFTLDSYGFGGDLTGKQLNLTIELTDDVRGPDANAGAYLVSLVSVSTYQYDPEDVGTDAGTDAGSGGTCSGDTAGTGGTATGTGAGGTATGTDTGTSTGTGGTATGTGAGGTSATGDGVGGTCADTDGGLAGAGGAPVLSTGYTEAETPRESRLALRYVGDRATLVFALPDKTEAIDSYDPSTAIKINVRIYNQSYGVEMPDEGMGGAGGLGGMTSTETMSTSGSTSSGAISSGAMSSGAMSSGAMSSGSMSSSSSMSTSGTTGTGGMGGTEGMDGDTNTDGAAAEAIFDYITAEFAITHLSVTDRGVRP